MEQESAPMLMNLAEKGVECSIDKIFSNVELGGNVEKTKGKNGKEHALTQVRAVDLNSKISQIGLFDESENMETFVGSVVDRAVRCGSSRIVGIQTLMFQVSTKKLQCDLGDKSKKNSHLVGECFIEEQTGKTRDVSVQLCCECHEPEFHDIDFSAENSEYQGDICLLCKMLFLGHTNPDIRKHLKAVHFENPSVELGDQHGK